jgi:hypothetical protein
VFFSFKTKESRPLLQNNAANTVTIQANYLLLITAHSLKLEKAQIILA